MKKVALCMRGAVGKVSGDLPMAGDLYNSSKYLNYTQCYNSIVRHILEPNKHLYDIDIFQHCWSVDLEKELVELYKPKAYIFEDNRKYNEEIGKLCRNPNDFSGISQALAIKKSIEIKEAYEKQNTISYDIVILYRYDVLLWKNIDISTYDLTSLNIYVNGDINSDFHFIMNNKNANTFKYLYNSILYNNPHRIHFWISNYIVHYMKVPVYADTIMPGRFQEVIRKIWEFSINKGYLSLEQFNSYL
jgi:hypothetical protein